MKCSKCGKTAIYREGDVGACFEHKSIAVKAATKKMLRLNSLSSSLWDPKFAENVLNQKFKGSHYKRSR